MKQRIKLNEAKLQRIIGESVKKILREANDSSVVEQFAECITELDENSAHFIASELSREPGGVKFMQFIVEHMNGYGYGGPNIDGDNRLDF